MKLTKLTNLKKIKKIYNQNFFQKIVDPKK